MVAFTFVPEQISGEFGVFTFKLGETGWGFTTQEATVLKPVELHPLKAVQFSRAT